ncbi:MAG: hypothetical protein HY226_06045 [Candidatus Vogelbacteria bacterium]|nr:hypothetical protein [Candidatus Vogelbacteria bacterium]
MDFNSQRYQVKIGPELSKKVSETIERQKESFERSFLMAMAIIKNHGGNSTITNRGLLVQTEKNPTHEEADRILEQMTWLESLRILKKGSVKVHTRGDNDPGLTYVAFFSDVKDDNN